MRGISKLDDVLVGHAEAGELPGRKVGGQWRFARAAVLRRLDSAG